MESLEHISHTRRRKAVSAESYSPSPPASTLREETFRHDESSPPIFSNGVRAFFKSQSPEMRNTRPSPSPDRTAAAEIPVSRAFRFLKIFEKIPDTVTPFKG